MERGNYPIYIFMFLILIIITLLLLTFVPFPNSYATGVEKIGPYKLEKVENHFTTKEFVTNSSVSFQGFFYLEKLQKTAVTTSCSPTDPSSLNCNSGRYSLCSCNGTNCSNCEHKGFIPLINFNDIVTLELLGAPDGGRQGKASVQLTFKTESSGDIDDPSGNPVNPEFYPKDTTGNSNTASFIYIETFVLPPLPFQKWFMITISRVGRRFDIYYNDTLVLSKQISTMLYHNATSQNISIGNKFMNGSSGYFTLYKSIQTAIDISKQYHRFVNTRGSPVFGQNPPTIGLMNVSLDRLPTVFGNITVPSICGSGDCITSPSNPPASPIYEWSSSYA